MVLFVEPGKIRIKRIPDGGDLSLFFRSTSSSFQQQSREFAAQSLRSVSPENGLLYVSQSEMGLTVPEDPNVSILGSEDATTCHILFLRHLETGATACTHIDSVCEDDLDGVVEKVLKAAGCSDAGKLAG